jgi:hypothetical protein
MAGGKFPRRVFLAAAIFGLLVIIPLYFLEGLVEQRSPRAVIHPEFYYRFAGAPSPGRWLFC